MSLEVENAIFDLLGRLAPGKSVSPEDVAKAVDAAGWRRELGKVKPVAVGLARAGKLRILRHNKPVNPEKFKGVWRMRLPLEDDQVPAADAPEADEAE
ncbi:DUF3253 domain-containing protein [Phenylobacterium sp. J426]|uniref:DUF3253 domain-containing protein n=1 Tax=Phenylobacterium sp. J426 TaxID=2898439 RepID=UPI002151B8DA|nr:DUF3253 domain-containing protein [Phenylobacterium sp. J426]MCR5874878.1 DUF3253 domain-containing protein [Phenylobacterium sp. J426]